MTRSPRLRMALAIALVALALFASLAEPAVVAQVPEAVITVCPPPGTGCDYTTIQEAIENSVPGDEIWVAAGTYVENLQIQQDVDVLGGYSGPPNWIRDPDVYMTVIDGSANPPVPGDWDGAQVRYPMVINEAGLYRMWYQGCDMAGVCSIGYAESLDGVTWDRLPDPVLTPGEEGAWDSGSLEAPYVIRLYPSFYQMWYSGFGPEQCAIGYATSTDGVAWTKQGEWPVLGPGGEGWNNNCAMHPSVLYEDGIYKMWLVTQGDDGDGQDLYMAYATSTDGYSDWTFHNGPIFARTWEQAFWRPFVINVGGTYRMWYSAWIGEGVIGLAESPTGYDGWSNYGGPVLSGDPGEWDEGATINPSVLYDGYTYWLWYDNTHSLGMANSGDGIVWGKVPPGSPVFEPGYYGEDGMSTVGIWTPGAVGQDSRRARSNIDSLVSPASVPVESTTSVLLDGLQITGGQACGGGVGIYGAQATINDCEIYGNTAVFFCGGGGVAVADPSASASITASQIYSNDALDGGGVMFWEGASGWIEGSYIQNNTTRGGPGGGVEVHGGGSVTIEGSDIGYNYASGDGGGIAVLQGSTLSMLSAAYVYDNTAQNWGGGIWAGNASVNLENVEIHDNASLDGEGGGLVLWDGTTAVLTAMGVSDNDAQHGAGGINVGEGSTVSMDVVGIVGNTSRWSAGLRLHNSEAYGDKVWIMYNEATDNDQGGYQLGYFSHMELTNAVIAYNGGGAGGAWDNSEVVLRNVTVADNWRDGDGGGGLYVAGDSSTDVYGSILAFNGGPDISCDEGAMCTVEYSDLQYPWPGPGNISTNPRFVDRAAADYHLQGGSPCIDAADYVGAPGDDFEGEGRPYDGDDVPGAVPDMGADEYTGEPMPIEPVTDVWVDGTPGTEGTGTPEDPYETIDEGIWGAFAGDSVHVAEGTYVENLQIDKDLNLFGGYSGVPDWIRDPEMYPTVVDGSGYPTIPGDWDGVMGMLHVVYDPYAGHYKMYYAGSGVGWPWSIGLATSPDGINWEKYPDNPILMPDGETWEGNEIIEPYVRIEGESNYRMWYDNGSAIGYAISTDGINWEKHEFNPIFEPEPGAWDSVQVRVPSVVWTGGEYLMSYIGHDGANPWQMGVATSANGIDGWSRTGPVLSPDPGTFDEDAIYRPDLALNGGMYHLMYVGVSEGWGRWQIGVATSPDGTNWAKYEGNPVLPGDAPWENQAGWGVSHMYEGMVWEAWYAGIGNEAAGFGRADSEDGFEWSPYPGNPVMVPGSEGQEGAPVISIPTPGGGALATGPEGLPDSARLAAGGNPAQEPVQVLLDGLTITGGTYWEGAGVRCDWGDITIQGCTVTGNEALQTGGGIQARGGSTIGIFGSAVEYNVAQDRAGGLFVTEGSHLTMGDTSVRGNQALNGMGGGICVEGEGATANLSEMAIWENQAGDGAGGLLLDGEPGPEAMLNGVFIGGNVGNWSAGLHLHRSILYGDRVWIMSNVGTDGKGGFQIDTDSVLTLENAVIAGNEGGAGGAWGNSSLLLNSDTLADNTRSDGWGGLDIGEGSDATVLNSILYYNGDGDLGCDETATCTVEYSDLEHEWPGPGNISAEPQFGEAYHLLIGSPCIDTASEAYAPDHDYEGDPRPVDGDGSGTAEDDMGADEWVAGGAEATVRVGSSSVAPGGSTTVPLEALGVPDPGVGAATIEVQFDPSVVQATDCAADPGGLYNAAFCNYDNDLGMVTLAAISVAGVPGDSLLAEITFEGIGAVGDWTLLDVVIDTFTDPDGIPIPAIDEDGEIVVGIDGDVSCDGETNSVDALFILQYEVDLRGPNSGCPLPPDTMNILACDVSQDGDCNVVDALFILQCEVGIPNIFCPDPAASRPEEGFTPFDPLQDAVLSIGSADVAPGGNVTIAMDADLGTYTLGAATIEVQYDTSVVQVTACDPDPNGLLDLEVCNYNNTTGIVAFSAVSILGVTGNLVLADITFEAVGNPGESSALTLTPETFADPGGGPVPVTTQDGVINVVEAAEHYLYLPVVMKNY